MLIVTNNQRFIFIFLLQVFHYTTQSSLSNPIAITKATNLLESLAKILNGQSDEHIEDYMDSEFMYDKCNNKLNKESSLDLMRNYSAKSPFSFTILDAQLVDTYLVYRVVIKDSEPKFTAMYNATSDESLRGKYRLLNGEELSC